MEDLASISIILDFVPSETPLPTSRLQRTLAFVAAGLVIASLAAIVAVIAATPLGVGEHDGFSKGPWPFILVLPGIALPIGFILIIILLVISAVRRGKVNRSR